MKQEILPNSLLNGKYLHCRPVENGPIIEAPILPSEGELTEGEITIARVIIVCEARRSRSKCEMKIIAGSKDDHCQYYKGDSLGGYQIIGPGMDNKSTRGYK